LGSLHLGDEGWEENLGDPEESDVEHGVHAVLPCGAGQGKGVGANGAIGGIVAVVPNQWGGFDASKDEEEEDGETHGSG